MGGRESAGLLAEEWNARNGFVIGGSGSGDEVDGFDLHPRRRMGYIAVENGLCCGLKNKSGPDHQYSV
jgi:hypothetical protein